MIVKGDSQLATDFTHLQRRLIEMAGDKSEEWKWSSCGLWSDHQSLPVFIHSDGYLPSTNKARILVLVSADDTLKSLSISEDVFGCYMKHPDQDKIALTLIPVTDLNDDSDSVSTISQGYPPARPFYQDTSGTQKQYLWRWITFNAPDLILEVCPGDSVRWQANGAISDLPLTVGATRIPVDDSLLAAIGIENIDAPGTIPGLRLSADGSNVALEINRLLDVVGKTRGWKSSRARIELTRRRDRSYLEIARSLAEHYGHDLDVMVYTKGVAISGRLLLAERLAKDKDILEDLDSIIAPFISGNIDYFGDNPGSASIGGIVWAYDLARIRQDSRGKDLIIKAAELFEANGSGSPPKCTDPAFRVEDMFNCNTILGRAYSLIEDPKYLNIMSDLLLDAGTQQKNGLFFHARGVPYYWGRGNGFAAMGFAESLTYMPEDYPTRNKLIDIHVNHLAALRNLQQLSGMYWQILDLPGSYQEFTCTCMIGYAMARGIRLGWLDPSYTESVNLAWQGVSERIDDAGNVVDACVSTGVQNSVEEYLLREAILGPDDRSGALALWFALEMQQMDDYLGKQVA
ncbi:MAG: hypothetical protein CL886_06695 [Dehalococcoidia bacterium]|nr:hypothetical protein [Dehalococcoidia bacterium]